MADIGKPIREINVQPKEAPIPQPATMPTQAPVELPAPALVPA